MLSYRSVGAWRSPVAHLHGVQGVAGSNPVAPTIFYPTTLSLVFLKGLLPVSNSSVNALVCSSAIIDPYLYSTGV